MSELRKLKPCICICKGELSLREGRILLMRFNKKLGFYYECSACHKPAEVEEKEGEVSKYLIFENYEEGVLVLNKGTRTVVGKIYFYPHWKQFVFEPKAYSVFSDECLQDIIWKIKLLNK